MLNSKDTLVILIDIQEKLVRALDKDIIVNNAIKLCKAASLLDIPILYTQQYPQGLCETVAKLKAEFLEGTKSFDKSSFSACADEGFLELVKSYNKKQILICGIETHICVHQTASDLLEAGYEVYVAKDVCASRRKYEFKQGIEAMCQNGAKPTCLEIVLFEWLKTSKHPRFKEVQNLIK